MAHTVHMIESIWIRMWNSRGLVLGSVKPDVLPSRQHHCSVDKWLSLDVRCGTGRQPTMENGPLLLLLLPLPTTAAAAAAATAAAATTTTTMTMTMSLPLPPLRGFDNVRHKL